MTKQLITIGAWALAATALAQPTDIPNAQPGKCYAKCLVHDKYETVTEQIMTRPESAERVAVPPVFKTIEAQYVAKESSTRLVAVAAAFDVVEEKILVSPPGRKTNPAAYEAVQEDVLVKPASKSYVVTDALFETVQTPVEIESAYDLFEVLPQRYESVLERIEVRPPGTKWIRKKSDRDCLGADPDDCFVWCLVEVPAQYQTIYRQEPIGCEGEDPADCIRYTSVAEKTVLKPVQKVKTPATSTERTDPAEYQTITKWVLKPGTAEPVADGPGEFVTVRKKVLKTPAAVQAEIVPAEYKPITRKVVVEAASLKTESLPAEYVTIVKRRLVRKGGFPEWREILCGEKMTGYNVRQIQQALQALGYYQGTVDGTLNARTKSALAQFQQERDLPADGNVDFETLKALGIGM